MNIISIRLIIIMMMIIIISSSSSRWNTESLNIYRGLYSNVETTSEQVFASSLVFQH